jgi:hypothetical protein
MIMRTTQAQAQIMNCFDVKLLMKAMRMKQFNSELLVAQVVIQECKFNIWLQPDMKIILVKNFIYEVYGEITIDCARRLIRTDFKRRNN